MLQIKDLSISMKKDLRPLLSGFSFALNPGDRVAVIGEEGDGKSTLLKIIYDESMAGEYAEWSGQVMKNGLLLGYLGQEVSPQEGALSGYEFCCREPAFLESSPGEISSAAGKLGVPVELFYTERPVCTMSGGEKVKLRMALLTLKRPDVYLLDEPSNDLDVETLRWLEGFILGCGRPVMYISHDEALLENTANVILHMELLRRKTLPRWTVARMGYRQYVEERLGRFQKQEQLAKKEREEDRKRQEKIAKMEQQVQHALDTVSRQDPGKGRLLKKKMKSVKSMEHRYDRERGDMTELPDTEEAILAGFDPGISIPAGKTVLELDLPELRAEDGARLAENVRLTVRGPEHICITGRNGAGKTTLLRRIAELLLERTDIKAAYMPQNYADTLDQRMTPVEFLTGGSGEKEKLTRAKTFLGSMKYTPEECAHSIEGLSGGQKAKLFFLRMILSGSNVLILDEPTRNFSPLSGPVIRGMIEGFGGCVISVSHDRRFIEQAGGTLYELTGEGLSEIIKRY